MRYLLITYMRKPHGQVDEVVELAKRVKSSDQAMCSVILDYAKKEVLKCVIEGNRVETTWDNLDAYYKQAYPNVIERLEREAALERKIK